MNLLYPLRWVVMVRGGWRSSAWQGRVLQLPPRRGLDMRLITFFLLSLTLMGFLISVIIVGVVSYRLALWFLRGGS